MLAEVMMHWYAIIHSKLWLVAGQYKLLERRRKVSRQRQV